MKIVDLTSEHENLFFVCLEDWSEEINEAGSHKETWYRRMKGKGLRVKLAQDDNGKIGGMIQYLPIEHSFAEGEDLYFVHCIWVHGHKQGRGNFQHRGMGKALLHTAEADAKERGAKGLVVWGISLPFWMKASWFKKQGYKKVDKQGMQVLLWKPFTNDAMPPKWIVQKKKPDRVQGKVTVDVFRNGWCTAQNMIYERAKRAASEFGNRVIFREFDTCERDAFLEWGIADALFIDGKEIKTGPPPPYKKIRKIIQKKTKKLQQAGEKHEKEAN